MEAAIGRAGISQMRIMGPHYDFHAPKTTAEIFSERVERLCHMRVAQIPCVHPSLKHAPVVLFRISHEPGILLCREKLVFGDSPVPVQILKSSLLQVSELLHDLVSTGL